MNLFLNKSCFLPWLLLWQFCKLTAEKFLIFGLMLIKILNKTFNLNR